MGGGGQGHPPLLCLLSVAAPGALLPGPGEVHYPPTPSNMFVQILVDGLLGEEISDNMMIAPVIVYLEFIWL